MVLVMELPPKQQIAILNFNEIFLVLKEYLNDFKFDRVNLIKFSEIESLGNNSLVFNAIKYGENLITNNNTSNKLGKGNDASKKKNLIIEYFPPYHDGKEIRHRMRISNYDSSRESKSQMINLQNLINKIGFSESKFYNSRKGKFLDLYLLTESDQI